MGVAPNKLVAKIASELEKPDGLTVITADNLRAVLDPLSLRRLPGLGRKLGERVEGAGLHTLGQLRSAPDALLWPIFGRDSQRMRERAAGIDDRPVMAEWDEKSIWAEETFFVDLVEHARMRSEVLRLADRAGARMRAQNLATGCVQVKIRRADFTTFTRQKRFEPSTTDSRTIAKIAAELLTSWLEEQPGARVRLLGVGVNHLHAADQLDLFAAAAPSASALPRRRWTAPSTSSASVSGIWRYGVAVRCRRRAGPRNPPKICPRRRPGRAPVAPRRQPRSAGSPASKAHVILPAIFQACRHS